VTDRSVPSTRRSRRHLEGHHWRGPLSQRAPHRRNARRRMEPLWSPVVANGGNQWQISQPSKPPKQSKTVAVGCDQLRGGAHGKEGVDGSSPSEGSAKDLQNCDFCFFVS